jgi:hypothetical protein
MVYEESAQTISMKCATTLVAADLGRFVFIDTDGNCLLDPGVTGNTFPFGVLAGISNVTTSTDHACVPVVIGGVAKVRMAAASTLSLGNYIAASSNGYGTSPTTDAYIAGVVVGGASGASGRYLSVLLKPGPLSVL